MLATALLQAIKAGCVFTFMNMPASPIHIRSYRVDLTLRPERLTLTGDGDQISISRDVGPSSNSPRPASHSHTVTSERPSLPKPSVAIT